MTLGRSKPKAHTIFFKIDYFDRNLTYHSPDPSDPAVTRRVITIMPQRRLACSSCDPMRHDGWPPNRAMIPRHEP
jgi:Protein of unknown function (DUF3768)